MLQKHLASGSSPWLLMVDSFGSKLMKVNFKGFQNFDQHFVQRESKPNFHEASENHHYVSFGKRNIILPSGPHG
jgi:hypothetical protein